MVSFAIDSSQTTIGDVEGMTWHMGYIYAGVALPILVYLLFTSFWFFNSIVLSILSLGKNR
jgi:VIT1/CCC1 family predicted Fe2+/Mn2+ transporter